MRKISSSMTFFNKRVFPIVCFGFLAFFFVAMIPEVVAGRAPIFILAIPIIMSVFGYLMMRALVLDLVDEVCLDEDMLIIRNRGEEERISISDVINVDASVMTNPERITLTLAEPCRFGEEIAFSPPQRWFPFKRNPLAKEIMQLAQRARSA